MPTVARSGREIIEVGPLEILPDEHLARAKGTGADALDPGAEASHRLARRADRIISREELFAWSGAVRCAPGDRSVDVYVRKLRVKLEVALPGWRFIHTHFGFGYRLAAEPRTPR